MGNLFSQKKDETKQKKKKGKLFYVFTTMTSLSAVDNLECNNAGNKSVQNCKKMKMLFFIADENLNTTKICIMILNGLGFKLHFQ